MKEETLVSMFYSQAAAHAGRTAVRVKRDGKYVDVPWSEMADRARALAAGLIAQGVQPGDRIGILSENRLEWFLADFAILSVGAITVALHAPLTARQVLDQFADCGPVAVFLSGDVQRDKLRSVRAGLPCVQTVYIFEEKSADSADIEPLNRLEARGRELLAIDPDCVERRLRTITADTLAAILYTSGTTGEPKGAMLSHRNFVFNMRAGEPRWPTDPAEELIGLLFLPVSHIFARTCEYYFPLATGRIIAIAESIDALPMNLQEVQPHYFSGVPRVFDKIAALTRPHFEAGMKDALILALGGRIRFCGSGGGALSPDVARYCEEAGVPVFQGYGLTETSPVIACSYPGHNKIGSSGTVLDGVEVRIAADGEILTRGPHVMQGYWNKPQATADAIDSEGWFHTGDIGALDNDGYLFITDRKKDLFKTAYGKMVAPQQLEGMLCFDPYIDQAFVYGDGRKFLTALIVPASQAVEEFARKAGLTSTPFPELVRHPDLHTLYADRISMALCSLGSHEQIRRFILLPEPFSLARGEMTVTAKLRRKEIVGRFQEQLEALYQED